MHINIPKLPPHERDVQTETFPGNDTLYQKAWNAIGDYYADRLKWSSAVSYYQQSQNVEKLVECYYLLEDYDKLSGLIDQVPDNSVLLEVLPYHFSIFVVSYF